MTTSWGNWSFDEKSFSLDHRSGSNVDYTIDLSTCTNAAEVLDWIAQIAGKSTGDADMATLIKAFDAIFGLQDSLCGLGEVRTIDPRTVAKQRGY